MNAFGADDLSGGIYRHQDVSRRVGLSSCVHCCRCYHARNASRTARSFFATTASGASAAPVSTAASSAAAGIAATAAAGTAAAGAVTMRSHGGRHDAGDRE